jgi:SAM-dependent methyltransferase
MASRLQRGRPVLAEEASRPPKVAAAETTLVLRSHDGDVEIEPLGGERYRVTLHPKTTSVPPERRTAETTLPPAIVHELLRLSFPRLCDTLARHDDPTYVIRAVVGQVMAYCEPRELDGRRILDFGCGAGASTLCLAAALPRTEVLGVELDADLVEHARRIAAFRRLENVRFLVSPDGSRLPAGLEPCDVVMLSAVYEHLLPDERAVLLPLLWRQLRPGGVLFINQTPYRYFPYEHHSTGLWLINYLPDPCALFLARRFSRINRDDNGARDWRGHLRGGIRGGTEGEILAHLRRAGDGRPAVMQPREQDRAAYWLARTAPDRYRRAKHLVARFFRWTDRLLGTVPSMNLDVAIRKVATL